MKEIESLIKGKTDYLSMGRPGKIPRKPTKRRIPLSRDFLAKQRSSLKKLLKENPRLTAKDIKRRNLLDPRIPLNKLSEMCSSVRNELRIMPPKAIEIPAMPGTKAETVRELTKREVPLIDNPKLIRVVKENIDLSNTELARKAGVSPATILRIRNKHGLKNPRETRGIREQPLIMQRRNKEIVELSRKGNSYGEIAKIIAEKYGQKHLTRQAISLIVRKAREER